MKINKIILVAVMVMSGWIANAQSQFDKFEDIEGVTSVVVTQKAFSLMSKIGQDSDEEYMDLIKNINSLKVFATESAEVAKQMESAAKSYLKSANLEELMRVKDDGSNVTIYVKEGKSEDFVKELFMFVKDSDSTSKESVIISLTGDIDLNQIAKLTDKMDLPGGEHLEKASKQ
ncbi:DUF4252 domain-containing protein [Lutimonas zeaxanthinifaciens]|uniref:DUF4252 domain-containing protein n=1 Tax=Lutimonas zeaxanthinifaciens TaxID=3060215 RepID=UPI00265D5D18|nr:DUF4252 domain-containing protein [Lutimonas sp. YSD2104]WKK64559.1 DUF4252 domain-containing protein [Lutimonas sp. YSD2104]